jgi:hypothetical protein
MQRTDGELDLADQLRGLALGGFLLALVASALLIAGGCTGFAFVRAAFDVTEWAGLVGLIPAASICAAYGLVFLLHGSHAHWRRCAVVALGLAAVALVPIGMISDGLEAMNVIVRLGVISHLLFAAGNFCMRHADRLVDVEDWIRGRRDEIDPIGRIERIEREEGLPKSEPPQSKPIGIEFEEAMVGYCWDPKAAPNGPEYKIETDFCGSIEDLSRFLEEHRS